MLKYHCSGTSIYTYTLDELITKLYNLLIECRVKRKSGMADRWFHCINRVIRNLHDSNKASGQNKNGEYYVKEYYKAKGIKINSGWY